MQVDISAAEGLLERVALFAEKGWIPPASIAATETIHELSSEGLNADGTRFENWDEDQVYSPSQQRKRIIAKVGIDQKDIRIAGTLLDALKLRTIDGLPSLAVSDSDSKLNRIAHGQMYHPKWRYHHKFLAVGNRMMKKIKVAISVAFKTAH